MRKKQQRRLEGAIGEIAVETREWGARCPVKKAFLKGKLSTESDTDRLRSTIRFGNTEVTGHLVLFGSDRIKA